MGLDLSHVFLDGQLLASEQTTLFTLIDIQAGERVYEEICAAIVVVSLNNNVCCCGRLLLLLFLELDGTLAEVVWIDEDVVVIARLVREGFGDDVLLREVEGAHWPILVAFKRRCRVAIAIFHAISDITLK